MADQRDPKEVEKALNDDKVTAKKQGESGKESGKKASDSNKARAKRPK